MEAEVLFHVDGQRMDGWADMTNPILTFYSFVNMSKKFKIKINFLLVPMFSYTDNNAQ
jgi:hypothetical protein